MMGTLSLDLGSYPTLASHVILSNRFSFTFNLQSLYKNTRKETLWWMIMMTRAISVLVPLILIKKMVCFVSRPQTSHSVGHIHGALAPPLGRRHPHSERNPNAKPRVDQKVGIGSTTPDGVTCDLKSCSPVPRILISQTEQDLTRLQA